MNIYSDIQFSNAIVLKNEFFNDKTVLCFYFSSFIINSLFLLNFYSKFAYSLMILFSLPQIFPNPTYTPYSPFSCFFLLSSMHSPPKAFQRKEEI